MIRLQTEHLEVSVAREAARTARMVTASQGLDHSSMMFITLISCIGKVSNLHLCK